jgi:3-methyl-2-oxobutanoate hydroxymethyltransferase
MLDRVRAIVDSGIPVMGHIGLTPQSATALGGYRAQGRTAETARRLYDDALALQEAGCFAIVLESVPA